MNWMQWLIALLVICSFGISIYYYDAMPEYVVSHWDSAGEPDGYMEKGAGVFFLPVLLVVFVAVFYLIPHIDPLKENIKKFDRYYQGFVVLFVAFLAYTHFLSIAWNLGYSFNISKLMAPVLGIIFIYLGMLCGHCRQNWFIGIRTPWTLSSKRVWQRTHNIAKNLFIAIGLLWIAVGILAPEYMLYMVVLLVLAALGLFVDSYFEYKRELGEAKPMRTEVRKISPQTKAAAKKAVLPKPQRKRAKKKVAAKTRKKKSVKK